MYHRAMSSDVRYFLYARKSTDDKSRQVRSIEAQQSELRLIIEQQNLTLVAELEEKQSAKMPGRPIFNRMLERIDAGEADGILAWHADRLTRNALDAAQLIQLFETGKLK